MNRQQKFVFGFALLAAIGLVAALGVASAYRGDPSVQGPAYDEDRHELMEEAFENLDYDAWASLMEGKGRARVLDVVNEENFAMFVAAHEAAEAGDFELAAQLRAELGLNNGNGPRDGTGYRAGQGRGKGMGQGRGMHNGQGNCYAQ